MQHADTVMTRPRQMKCNNGQKTSYLTGFVTFQEIEIAHGVWEEWGASGFHLKRHRKIRVGSRLELSIKYNVKTTHHLPGAANGPGGQGEEEERVQKPGGVLVLAGPVLAVGLRV